MLRTDGRLFIAKVRLLSMVTVALSLVIFTMILGGCTARQAGEPNRSYPHDGYLGLPHSNPNLQTNPTHYTYSKDAKLVRQVLDEMPEVRDAIVLINGGTLYVRLELEDGLEPSEVERIKQEALERLDFSFPRYEVKVSSDRDM